MSKSTTEEKSPAPPSSDTRHVEFYLFACGHGDTLLVRLPDDRWALIDCYLPKRAGARKRFFEFVEEKQINHLAIVFQTHPDYDHYLGMHDVLTHFIETDGKSVGLYVDSGLNIQQIHRLLGKPKRPGYNEYSKLQGALRDWDDQGLVQLYGGLDSERHPVYPKGYAGRIDFIPIAPNPKLSRRLTETSIQKYGKNPKAKQEANELSLVLALAVNDGDACFNVLLCADAGIGGIKRALAVWRDFAEEQKISDRFDIIKVSHHGSIKNHVPDLCEYGPEDRPKKIAAVSAGERDALPDRAVLADYIEGDWTVMVTTVRKKSRVDRAVDLHLKREDELAFDQNTIEVKWNRDGEVSIGPDAAIVAKDDLNAYKTAEA